MPGEYFLYYDPCTIIPSRAAGDNTNITLVGLEMGDQCEQFLRHVYLKHLPYSGKTFFKGVTELQRICDDS